MSLTGKGIPPEILQQIRDRIDLIDVISRYVTLSKAGQNYKGLCPFHTEKSPSFSVSPSRQMFHCFGCGEGGDAFTFLMKREGIGFMEAVQELAQVASVTLPSWGGRDQSTAQTSSERERSQQIHVLAAEWFRDNLLATEIGKPARSYLKDRGISDDTIQEFGLGYAPPGWSGLLNYLKKSEVKTEEMLKAGLVAKRDSSASSSSMDQAYDRFRDRIIFPICNIRGQVIAFGGRGLSSEQIPKYLNSPETVLFNKSRTLFGFDKTRDVASRLDRLIMVEGYFDVLALYQYGVQHVVAPLGTSLTSEHVQTIRRIVKTVTLFFDGDAAGTKAALRTLDLFMNTGLTVKVMELPAGEDPDTFIRSQGCEALTQLEDHAPTLLDFAVQASLKGRKARSIEERVRSVDEILRLLHKSTNLIEKEEWIRQISEQLGIRQQLLIDRFPTLNPKTIQRTPSRQAPSGAQDRMKPLPKGNPEERDVVMLTLQGALNAQHIERLRVELFTVPAYQQIIELSLQHVGSDGRVDVESLSSAALNDQDAGSLVPRLSLSESHFDNVDGHIQECLASLERKQLQISLNELIAKLRLAEREQRVNDIEVLNRQIDELREKKATLAISSSILG